MIRVLLTAGVLILLIFNFSCSNRHVEIPIEQILFDGDKTQGYIGNFIIIRDSADFNKYSQIFSEHCDSLKLPNIDLSKNSIIGKTIVIDNVCHLLDSETRYYKTKKNLFIYEIEIIHAGIRDNRYLIWSYSIIPKLSSNDSVQFRIEYSRDWFYID